MFDFKLNMRFSFQFAKGANDIKIADCIRNDSDKMVTLPISVLKARITDQLKITAQMKSVG